MHRPAHNTANNDTPFFDKDYCGRSIVALRVLADKSFLSSRHNGVVGRDVARIERLNIEWSQQCLKKNELEQGVSKANLML